MCTGVAIDRCEIPDALLEEFDLAPQLTTRGPTATPEIQFRYQDKTPRLPVWLDGRLQLITWGNRDDKASKLPKTGWCRTDSLEEGKWRWLHPEEVDIRANYGLEKGVWFAIPEGIRGVVINDEQRRPHVYMLTQAASHYYEVMTRHARMPVLIGEQI